MAALITFRARSRAVPFTARSFSLSRRWLNESDQIPRPPRPIDDSTSALEYKQVHRARPPPLPAMDLPRSRTAEEAVTNILYNTPPPSLQPFKKHILNCLVQNEPGVLSRVSGILAGRGFNIDSLVVCRTEIRDLSRMCIILRGQDGVVEQARRQLEDLVPVWAVIDYTDTNCIQRELLLAKVSILGPDYVEDQYHGGPTHEPRRKLEREVNLVHQIERSAHGQSAQAEQDTTSSLAPLTPTELLRLRNEHLRSISVLAEQFGARLVDVSENSVIVEMSGKTSKVEAFLALLKPYGLLESARTGLMAMPRSPFKTPEDSEDVSEERSGVDASLLPPG